MKVRIKHPPAMTEQEMETCPLDRQSWSIHENDTFRRGRIPITEIPASSALDIRIELMPGTYHLSCGYGASAMCRSFFVDIFGDAHYV